jgi:hypothetical protein
MGRKNKGGKELAQPKDQTPLLPLSGSRKVVRTPTNPFEAAGTIEVFVPKEIIARRIQQIFAGPNKGRKADHYLVVWEDYPLEKDYTWEPIENQACLKRKKMIKSLPQTQENDQNGFKLASNARK